jgi:hypothetical protein
MRCPSHGARRCLEVASALNVRIAHAPEPPLEFLDGCLDGPRRRLATLDALLDAGEQDRIVEKHEMGAEDERLVLPQIARRRRLELHDVVPRFLESVTHTLSLGFLAPRR